MKGLLLFLCTFLLSVHHLDAFVLSNRHHHRRREARSSFVDFDIAARATATCSSKNRVHHSQTRLDATSHLDDEFVEGSNTNTNTNTNTHTNATAASTAIARAFTHADIVWKIRPPSKTSLVRKMFMRTAANLIRLDCKLKRVDPPVLLCPVGGQAVLEAYARVVKKSFWRKTKLVKIGRFGITTESGPPCPAIQETVHDLYELDPNVMVRTAAIIYMFVEPDFRHRQMGTLALQVIPLLHAIQACDFTVLVADDDGSGKLVEWYQQHGYSLAPKLQDVFGSPDQKYGITMIAPTQSLVPQDCVIQWW
jgi:hypothetical protein